MYQWIAPQIANPSIRLCRCLKARGSHGREYRRRACRDKCSTITCERLSGFSAIITLDAQRRGAKRGSEQTLYAQALGRKASMARALITRLDGASDGAICPGVHGMTIVE